MAEKKVDIKRMIRIDEMNELNLCYSWWIEWNVWIKWNDLKWTKGRKWVKMCGFYGCSDWNDWINEIEWVECSDWND